MKDPHDAKALITRLEHLSRTDPGAYRFRVALVAMLGYGYLLGVVIGLLALVYLAVYLMILLHQLNFLILKVVWIPLVLAWLVIKSMWVSVPAPKGRELQPDQAPRLFELIAEIQTTLNSPKVHHVLLSDEFNASMVQIPEFGMFGWNRNYLVLGLPVMKALQPEEFRAVLAHEFGHLSGKHGAFNGWIYRLRRSWIQILARVQLERHYASFLFEWFLDWYTPYFNAYTFVLARAQEYEADSYSVELAGADIAARALVKFELKSHVLGEDFWSDLHQQASDSPQPPNSPFGLMLQAAQSPMPTLKAETLLRHSIKIKTGYDDTHPAMAERLSAIGIDASSITNESTLLKSVVGEQKESAAETYLPLIPDDVLNSFDRLWRENLARGWQQRHQTIQQKRKRLDELEQKRLQQPLTLDELWEQVLSLGEINEPSATLPIVREILDQQPENVKANWVMGSVLLEQSDPGGIQYLEKAMELDPSATGAGCELIYNFYQTQGKADEGQPFRLRADQYYEERRRYHEEAMNLSAHDQFEPHGLNDAEVAELRAQLKKVSGLATAYLVRKTVGGAAQPLYVFAVLAYPVFVNGRSQKNIPGLLNGLGSKLEFARLSVFVSLDAKPFLKNPIRQVAGAQIYAVN